MPVIKEKDLMYFENKLYLPMIIKVLEKDLESIDKLPFKLNRPYIKLVEDALKLVHKDLKSADIYLIRKQMQLTKWESTADSTTFAFIYMGTEERHKYLHTEIKTKCEEILYKYFTIN
ncbi:hypothetical protein [Psychrobacillus lasiicapitis]|uniref:Uncharacterized protein n=1 Tax=Psychrobacillus lasiicapitis TaxID=1636719 RepID=A0A544TAJ6_9BACI|nr:hypothetical protein [Psychrobacillus lasiicapitis]TQR14490.1 hypothetical protein FG382_08520 [Psychrobacillus lasiicapitis]GGA30881.1 hypothetical protein GCM10011384_20480 [Psychrobacillus lasiicapitis]